MSPRRRALSLPEIAFEQDVQDLIAADADGGKIARALAEQLIADTYDVYDTKADGRAVRADHGTSMLDVPLPANPV